MYSYELRIMKPDEKNLCKEYCYFENKIHTFIKVFGEQILFWLVLVFFIYVAFKLVLIHINIAVHILMIVSYVIGVIVGIKLRYAKERKIILAMQNQSSPIYQEFQNNKAESCKFKIKNAYKLEEKEDEGPTFVLDIGENNILVLSEHGKYKDDSNVPGDNVEVVRLPESKKIIATYWSGNPVSVTKTIKGEYLNQLSSHWSEGNILKSNVGL